MRDSTETKVSRGILFKVGMFGLFPWGIGILAVSIFFLKESEPLCIFVKKKNRFREKALLTMQNAAARKKSFTVNKITETTGRWILMFKFGSINLKQGESHKYFLYFLLPSRHLLDHTLFFKTLKNITIYNASKGKC